MSKRLMRTCGDALADCRRLWIALRCPGSPRWLKLGAALLALYVVSPLDRVPDVIPVFGWIDDLMLIPLATRYMLERLPPAVQEAVERQMGPRRQAPAAGARPPQP